MTMPSGHFSIDMLENDFDGPTQLRKSSASRSIACPFIGPDDRPTDAAGWRKFGERLARSAGEGAGIDFAWHNHHFEFERCRRHDAEGAHPRRAPDIGWEIDVAWVIRGGADPLKWIDDYGDRIVAVHVKDIAPAGQNADEDGWADVGHGTVDWKGLQAAARQDPGRILRHGARQSERLRSASPGGRSKLPSKF